jgi:hypothetical protein
MKKSRHSEEEIIAAVKQMEAGQKAAQGFPAADPVRSVGGVLEQRASPHLIPYGQP